MVDIAYHPRDGAWPQLARAREAAILHHSVDRRPSKPGAELDLRQPDQSSRRLHFVGHVLLQQDDPFQLERKSRASVIGSLEAALERTVRLSEPAVAATAKALAAGRISKEGGIPPSVRTATAVAVNREERLCAA